jgi:hypothetical protein
VVPPEGVNREAFTLAFLADHEGDCPACGYNVHALIQPRCPECGRPLEVQVVSAIGGVSAAWVTALIVEAVAAGIGLLVLLGEANDRMHDMRLSEPILMFSLLYFMCNLPVPAGVLVVRRWYVRWSALVQWMIASALIIMALVALVMLLSQVHR